MHIDICPITTKDVKLYKFFVDTLTDSFPKEEYRDLEKIANIADNDNRFNCCVLTHDESPVGIISYWELSDFCYIEHFAITKQMRSSNYGGSAMRSFIDHICKNIVLEVELPQDELTKRRVSFYQKLGFSLWESDYQQPPYRPSDEYIDMNIMSYGTLNEEKEFSEIKEKIHSIVYGVKQTHRQKIR